MTSSGARCKAVMQGQLWGAPPIALAKGIVTYAANVWHIPAMTLNAYDAFIATGLAVAECVICYAFDMAYLTISDC
jgi:ureidoglycolate hydrolase